MLVGLALNVIEGGGFTATVTCFVVAPPGPIAVSV